MALYNSFSACDKPLQNLDRMWEEVLFGIDNLLEGEMSNITYSQIYCSVYNYCKYKTYHAANAGIDLYFRLQSHLTSYLENVIERQAAEIKEDVLKFYTTEWARYNLAATLLTDMFIYLNNTWVLPRISAGRTDVFEIYHLCLVVWKDVMLHKLQEKILNSVTDKLFQHPSSEDSDLIIKTIQAYVDLGLAALPPHAKSFRPKIGKRERTSTPIFNVCSTYFEKPILIRIEQRFAAKARELLESHSIKEYLEHVQIWYDINIPPLPLTLPNLEKNIKLAIDKGLNSVHATLITDLCNLVLGDGDPEPEITIQLLVRLAAKSDCSSQVLKQHSLNYFENSGRDAIGKIFTDNNGSNASPHPVAFVTTVLDWKLRFFTTQLNPFQGIQGLESTFHEACATILNETSSKLSTSTAELLALYYDKTLRKHFNIEVHINNAITLLKCLYVEDQDAFLCFYTAAFAARQLDRGTMNEKAELLMLAELELAFGHLATYKLRKMLDDLRISKLECSNFKRHVQGNPIGKPLDFSIRILTDSLWSINKSSTVQLPKLLLEWTEKFEHYYCSKYNSRKLMWAHNHSNGILRITWCNTKYCNFDVSLPQMVLLLAFRKKDVLTVREIQDVTKLESPRLMDALEGLLSTKLLMCRTSDDVLDLEDQSEIHFNQSYEIENEQVVVKSHTSKLRRKDQADNHDHNHQIETEQAHMYMCQGAIVRFMKVQKVCKLDVLLDTVKVNLKSRFTATDSMLKKCLLILVGKEYLQECSSQLFEYLP